MLRWCKSTYSFWTLSGGASSLAKLFKYILLDTLLFNDVVIADLSQSPSDSFVFTIFVLIGHFIVSVVKELFHFLECIDREQSLLTTKQRLGLSWWWFGFYNNVNPVSLTRNIDASKKVLFDGAILICFNETQITLAHRTFSISSLLRQLLGNPPIHLWLTTGSSGNSSFINGSKYRWPEASNPSTIAAAIKRKALQRET